MFGPRTDQARGVIRSHGRLDCVSAELLERIVSALRQLGDRRIIVQLGSTTSAGRGPVALLQRLHRRLAADGVWLGIE